MKLFFLNKKLILNYIKKIILLSYISINIFFSNNLLIAQEKNNDSEKYFIPVFTEELENIKPDIITRNNIDIKNLLLQIEKQKKIIEIYKLENGFNINFNSNKVTFSFDNAKDALIDAQLHSNIVLNQNLNIILPDIEGIVFSLNNSFSYNYYDTNNSNIINPSFSDSLSLGLNFSLKSFLSKEYILNLNKMFLNLNNLKLQLEITRKNVYSQFLSYVISYYNTYYLKNLNEYNLFIEENNFNSIKNSYSKDSYTYLNQLNKIDSLKKLIEFEKLSLNNYKVKVYNLIGVKISFETIFNTIFKYIKEHLSNYQNYLTILSYNDFKIKSKKNYDIQVLQNLLKIDNLNKELNNKENIPDLTFSLNYNLELYNLFSDSFNFNDNNSHSISLQLNYSFDLNKNKINNLNNKIDELTIQISKNSIENKYKSNYMDYINTIETLNGLYNNITDKKSDINTISLELKEKIKNENIFGEFEINRLKKLLKINYIELNNYFIQLYKTLIDLKYFFE